MSASIPPPQLDAGPADLLRAEVLDAIGALDAGAEDARAKRAEDDASRFRLARATRLNTFLTRGLWREYRARFETAVMNDTAAFFAAPTLTDAQKTSIAARVDTAIRRIASFSAWYYVGNSLFRGGFSTALVAAYVTVAVLAFAGFLADGNVGTALASVLLGAIGIAVVERGARTLTHRWPFDAIACIVTLGIFTVAFHDVALLVLTTVLPQSVLSGAVLLQIVGIRVLFITASGIAVFAAVLLVVLLGVHRLSSKVTDRKLRFYPEDEIIQSLVAVLRSVQEPDERLISGADRGAVIDLLHWIGCRFENEFLNRFAHGDPATDEWLRDTGAQLAAACRLHERTAALTDGNSFERVAEYASRTLLRAAQGDWNSIERAPAAPPSPKRRLIDTLIDAGKTAFPAVLGLIAYVASLGSHPLVPPAIGQNALFTGLITSVVALWSIVDPHSDHGLERRSRSATC